MKYVVDVAGERIDVALEDGGATAQGQHTSAHLADVEGTPVHLVTLGDEVHRVVVRRGETRGAYVLWIDGHRYQVEALDERTRTIRDLTAASQKDVGPKPLVAPMPGMIVRVSVQVGDAVLAGQGVVVMEAMKMENELRSPSSGTVKAVWAVPGSAVEKGAVLVELA